MTAYRYDNRFPSSVAKDGFGRRENGNFAYDKLNIFARKTVFASLSSAGSDYFIENDYAAKIAFTQSRLTKEEIVGQGRTLSDYISINYKTNHYYRIKQTLTMLFLSEISMKFMGIDSYNTHMRRIFRSHTRVKDYPNIYL